MNISKLTPLPPHLTQGCRSEKRSDLYDMKKQHNTSPAKSYKPALTAQFSLMTPEQRETTNLQSRYYREKQLEFYNTASYEDLSSTVKELEPVVAEKQTAIQRAAKVRHNMPRNTYVATKYVMVGGVPHKMVNGKLTALTAQSK